MVDVEAKGQVLMGNYDSQVYIPLLSPWNAFSALPPYLPLWRRRVRERTLAWRCSRQVLAHSRLGTSDGFNVTSQDEMLETMSDVAFTLRLMLAAIGVISLVVELG